jgi:hypothetical protein
VTDIRGLPFRKRANSLVPLNEQADEFMAGVKDGGDVLVTARRARNLRFHRLLFAMLHKVVDNTDRWPDEEILLADLKEQTGYGHYRANGFSGVVTFAPDSISFAKCDEYKFKRLFNRFAYVLATKVLSCEPQELIDAVFSMVDGDSRNAWKYQKEAKRPVND